MVARGYFITINSDFTKVDDNEINMKQVSVFIQMIINMCTCAWKATNKVTKAHPEPTPFYKYIMFGGVEFGKEKKRMHIHGYVYCTKQKSIKELKKHWGNEAHFDVAKGTGNDIECYCLKGDHDKDAVKANKSLMCNPIYEKGERPKQGNRSDLVTAIEECESIGEFMDNNPELYCKYRNGIKDIYARKETLKPKTYEQPEIIWNYGATGLGKTRMAFEDEECVNVNYDNSFFSDWHEAKVISLEEMNGKIPYKTLLQLTDGYHNYYRINIKGGDKLVDLKRIYISSSVHPRDIYKQQELKEGGIEQLMRRITKINHFTSEGIIDETNISNDDLTNMNLC